MDICITEDVFVDTYKPRTNPFNPDAPWNGCMFETYGPEHEHVLAALSAEPDKVWTVLDCDGRLLVSSGYHYVNRMGYILTDVAVGPTDLITVDDGDDDFDHGDDEPVDD